MSKERVTPHSIEAEQAVLGAVLLSAKAWPVLASRLTELDFFRTAHQETFKAMRSVAATGATLDLLLVMEELRKAGQLENVGGLGYLTSLTDGVPSSSNVEHYAEIIREKARLRAVAEETKRVCELALDEAEPAGRLIDGLVSRLTSSIRVDTSGTVTVADAVKHYQQAMVDGKIAEPMPTGYTDLDELIGGFRPADLVIVAARPSVGKTSWALGVADALATAGKTILFFTLEMRVSGLAERMVAWRSRVSAQAVTRGSATPEEYTAVADALVNFAPIPLYFEPLSQSVTEIGAWCRRTKQDHGLDGVVIDYLQLLRADERKDSQEAETASISRALKGLAKELDIPVVALSQLSRAPEGRSDKRPQLSDLRYSGALEQDSDIAVLLYRPELHQRTEENAGICEVIVAKHRAGPTGVVRLYFDRDLAQFKNLSTVGRS